MRHFTIDEANALLPVLRPALEDLRDVHARMVRAIEEVRAFEVRAQQNGHGENTNVFVPEYDLQKLQGDVSTRIQYLQGMGIVLKDIQSGIVDFPTRMGERDVLLCWRIDEESVSHWHEIDSGYAGRRPI